MRSSWVNVVTLFSISAAESHSTWPCVDYRFFVHRSTRVKAAVRIFAVGCSGCRDINLIGTRTSDGISAIGSSVRQVALDLQTVIAMWTSVVLDPLDGSTGFVISQLIVYQLPADVLSDCINFLTAQELAYISGRRARFTRLLKSRDGS